MEILLHETCIYKSTEKRLKALVVRQARACWDDKFWVFKKLSKTVLKKTSFANTIFRLQEWKLIKKNCKLTTFQ